MSEIQPKPRNIIPHIVIGIFILFILFQGWAILKMSSQKVELVTKNYYSKDVNYEDRISEKNRTENLSSGLNYSYLEDRNILKIEYPREFRDSNISGSIYVYRPSDSAKDFKLPLAPSDSLYQIIPLQTFSKGTWRFKLSWEINGETYYDETKIWVK